MGAILTQNTAWINVEKAIHNLKVKKCLSAKAILGLVDHKLAGLIRPSGYFNVKAKRLKSFCRWYVDNGELKQLQKKSTAILRPEILKIHGIGPETADDILLYAFHRPVFVIDVYTRRLFQRLGLIKGNEPYEELRAWFEKKLVEDHHMFNEYHALIVRHAKVSCRKVPLCEQCILRDKLCSYDAPSYS